MSKELFLSLLDKDFYLKNKNLLYKDLFVGEVKDLFEVLEWAYENNVPSLKVPELKLLYAEREPTATLAKQSIINTFLEGLAKEQPVSKESAELALKQSLINRKADEAASLLIQQQDTKESRLEDVRALLKDIERLEVSNETDTNLVNMDINYLLQRTQENSKWKFNIPQLCDLVSGVGAGTFSIIAGRVNSGKSLSALSFCFSPDGFASQGAKILYLCNEEHGAFTGLRAVSCYTGLTRQEIANDIPSASKKFDEIKDKLIAFHDARISMAGLEGLVEKHRPDIVVCDMLDHIRIAGDHAREDIRLGQVYRQAREIANIYECAFIGVSQTSAESDGKMVYGFDALAGSKTDKPAACDLILLIGTNPANEETGIIDDVRAINVAKNKITGRHGKAMGVIKPFISRMVP